MTEWHWFYLIGIIWAVVNITAIITAGPADPEIENLWKDNF